MATLPPGSRQDPGARPHAQRTIRDVNRFRKAFAVALRGASLAWREEPNLRLEALIAVLVLILATWLRAAFAPLLLVMGLVLVAEVFNSAIERMVDLSSPEPHELAGNAKDLAAAAVLLASLTAVAVGAVVLGPPLLAKLGLGS